MLIIRLVIGIVVSYLFGSFNGAIVISKYFFRDDIRGHGSGNAGMTNFYRTFGGPMTFLVLALDVVKMVLAILIVRWLLAPTELAFQSTYIAGFCCMLGHIFPAFYRFKGGKAILTSCTWSVFIDWRVTLICLVIFLLCVVLTRYVSFGSVMAAVAFIILVPILPSPGWFCVLLVWISAVLIIWAHRENVQRLLRGEESRFSFRFEDRDT